MAIDIQQFPKWIYHPVHDAKIIHTSQELDTHFDQGWRTEKVAPFSEQAIKEQIAYHTKELERWMKALEAHNPPEKQAPISIDDVVLSDVSPFTEEDAPLGAQLDVPPAPPAEGTSELLIGDVDIGTRDNVKLIPQPGTPVMIAKPFHRQKSLLKDRVKKAVK